MKEVSKWWNGMTHKEQRAMVYKHYTFALEKVQEYEIEMMYEYEKR